MAEVLGIVAAVVGLAQAGSELSVLLYRFGRAAAFPARLKTAIERIQPEVALISTVSERLAGTLGSDENLRLCKFDTIKTIQNTVSACNKTLAALNSLLSGYFDGGTIGLLDRLKMYNVEKKVILHRADLGRLRSTLILILEIIRHARTVVKDQNSHKERDSEILVALKRESVDATLRYQKLMKAIANDGSGIAGQLSRLDISISNSVVSDSKGYQYAIIDNNGMEISEQSSGSYLALKLETISQLISEVEDAQKDVARATHVPEHSGIWESFFENGAERFRHTAITRHSQGPGTEKTRSNTTHSHPTHPPPIKHGFRVADVYIALIGAVGTGKSTFVNVCCEGPVAQTSQSPERCTQIIGEYQFMYTPEIKVHLIDTPGFDEAHRTEREILTDLLEWMSKSQGELTRLSGILYFHMISESKMHCSAYRNLRMFEKLCGANSIHSVILVTTNWEYFLGDDQRALLHEQELRAHDEYWGLMIQRGSSMIRHGANYDSAMRVLGTLGLLAHATTFSGHHPEVLERSHTFSESKIEFRTVEQEADELLAAYTTVLDTPHIQQRRWTMDLTYQGM